MADFFRKPNFFIIGAPKCGTTSLASWLSCHPNIYMSPNKEPHYFDTDHKRRTTRIEKYEALFSNADDTHMAIGEASVYYLFSKEAVINIEKYNPNSKFIVVLRNPVDMMYSLHDHYVYIGRENVDDFATAWGLDDYRRQGKNIPPRAWDPKRMVYGDVCRLGAQIERLFNTVRRVRVHIVFLEDIIRDPRKEYTRALSFLEVPDDGRMQFPIENAARKNKNQLLSNLITMAHDLKHKLNMKKKFGILNKLIKSNYAIRERESLSPEIRSKIIESLHGDIDKLERIVGKDLDHWRH